MKVVIVSKKPLMAAGIGRLPAGVPIDLKDNLANFFIERGEAVRAETKEAMDSPLADGGEAEQSSSSPADQASQETTLNESESGETPETPETPETAETAESVETPETPEVTTRKAGRPKKQ